MDQQPAVDIETPEQALRRRVDALEVKCNGLLSARELDDDKWETGHKRLRGDIRELKVLVESNFDHFDTSTGLLKAQVAAIKAQLEQPMDATKLVLTTKAIVGVVAFVLSLAGFVYGMKVSLEGQITAVRADLKDSGRVQDSSLKAEVLAVRSDLKDVANSQKEISNRIDAQKDAAAAAIRAQDVQLSALKDSIALTQKQSEQAQRQGELLRFEFQTLKETVLGKKPAGGGGGEER